jgi:uncharacterized membrane protein YccC
VIASMAVVGFAVLFVGILSPEIAAASTATLLIFVLPVAVAQPAGAVGPRLLGWALAGVVGIAASMVLWPTPWHDDLRRRLAATVSALAKLAAARADGSPGAVPVAQTIRGDSIPADRRREECRRIGQAGGSS